MPLLLLPALFVAVRVERARVYLYFYSMVLAFMLLVLIGFFGMHYRYVAAGQAVLFALGCAGLARMYADSLGSSPSMLAVKGLAPFSIIVVLVLAMTFWATRSLMTCLLTLAIPTLYLLGATARRVSGSGRLLGGCHIAAALFVAIASVASAAKARHEFDASLDTRHPAISDALEFLDDPRVPPGSAVIAEDELLNYVLAKRPDYLTHARSIQSFNVMTDSQRREALSRAGILYVSKRRNYGWNYLFYFPRAQWVTDPFRVAVLDMIRTNQPRSILGFVAEPIYNSSSRLVARIKPDLAGAPETTEPASQ